VRSQITKPFWASDFALLELHVFDRATGKAMHQADRVYCSGYVLDRDLAKPPAALSPEAQLGEPCAIPCLNSNAWRVSLSCMLRLKKSNVLDQRQLRLGCVLKRKLAPSMPQNQRYSLRNSTFTDAAGRFRYPWPRRRGTHNGSGCSRSQYPRWVG